MAIIVSEIHLDGWRSLWLMLHEVSGVTCNDYLNGFEHKHIGNFDLPSPWPGGKILTVVVLGDEAAENLGLGFELVTPLIRDGIAWRKVPRLGDSWYNEPAHRMMVGVLLEELLHAQN